MDKFQNQYRIPSTRAPWWDYGNNGFYFITICTAGHQCFFGEIINHRMVLSEIGMIVKTELEKSFEIRTELFCDVYVIMPNHIHAIIRIENKNDTTCEKYKTGVAYRSPKSVSSFVAGFKSVVTVNARKIHAGFAWQTRFHDHIIRNIDEYKKIERYILNNPRKWKTV